MSRDHVLTIPPGRVERRGRRPVEARGPGLHDRVVEIQRLGLLEPWLARLLSAQGRAGGGRHHWRGLQALGDGVGRLEHEEGLPPLAKLHGIRLLDAIDLELDLLLVRAQERKLAEPHMEGRAGQGAVLLLNHDHVDGPAEGGGIDRVPCRGDGVAEIPDVLHGVRTGEALVRFCRVFERVQVGSAPESPQRLDLLLSGRERNERRAGAGAGCAQQCKAEASGGVRFLLRTTTGRHCEASTLCK